MNSMFSALTKVGLIKPQEPAPIANWVDHLANSIVVIKKFSSTDLVMDEFASCLTLPQGQDELDIDYAPMVVVSSGELFSSLKYDFKSDNVPGLIVSGPKSFMPITEFCKLFKNARDILGFPLEACVLKSCSEYIQVRVYCNEIVPN